MGVIEFKVSQVLLSYALHSVISVHYLTMDYVHLLMFDLTVPPPSNPGFLKILFATLKP
jgi:hypothetical protein